MSVGYYVYYCRSSYFVIGEPKLEGERVKGLVC